MNERPHKPGIIFDPTGKEIAQPGEKLSELNLPPGTQALIEERINSGLDAMRENNRNALEQLAREYSKRWRSVAIFSVIGGSLSFAWGVFSWFVAPERVARVAQTYVQENFLKPPMQNALNKAVWEVVPEIVPMHTQGLEDRITELEHDRETEWKEDNVLADTQEALMEKIHMQEFWIRAKKGSKDAVAELQKAASEGGNASSDAEIYLEDLEASPDSPPSGKSVP